MFWSNLSKIQRAILKRRAAKAGIPKYKSPPPPEPQKSAEATKEEAELEIILKFIEIMKEGGWMIIDFDSGCCPECREKFGSRQTILMVSV